jgi:hypothetical protein
MRYNAALTAAAQNPPSFPPRAWVGVSGPHRRIPATRCPKVRRSRMRSFRPIFLSIARPAPPSRAPDLPEAEAALLTSPQHRMQKTAIFIGPPTRSHTLGPIIDDDARTALLWLGVMLRDRSHHRIKKQRFLIAVFGAIFAVANSTDLEGSSHAYVRSRPWLNMRRSDQTVPSRLPERRGAVRRTDWVEPRRRPWRFAPQSRQGVFSARRRDRSAASLRRRTCPTQPVNAKRCR